MEYESLTIRIPLELKHELELAAEREHRSVSGQVRFFLESAVRRLDTDDATADEAAEAVNWENV